MGQVDETVVDRQNRRVLSMEFSPPRENSKNWGQAVPNLLFFSKIKSHKKSAPWNV
jgi:hypothetical protein